MVNATISLYTGTIHADVVAEHLRTLGADNVTLYDGTPRATIYVSGIMQAPLIAALTLYASFISELSMNDFDYVGLDGK